MGALTTHLVEVAALLGSSQVIGYAALRLKAYWKIRGEPKAVFRVALLAEVLLYAGVKIRLKHFNDGALRPRPPNTERAKQLKERFLRLKKVLCLKSYLADWHLGADWDHILRGNVERFVALGYFEKEPNQLDTKQLEVVEEIVADLELSWGLQFQEGHSPHAKMIPGYDRLDSIHKPLTFYALMQAMGWGYSLMKRYLGYRPIAQDGLTFWMWEPRQSAQDILAANNAEAASKPAPLVFFHGLGPPFPPFLADLRALGGGRPVIVLQAKHLYQCLQWRASSATEVARATAALLERLGYEQACFLGHSYGTFYVSCTCQLFPQLVESVVLMDPVCLCSCYPQLAAATNAVPTWRDFPSLNFWTAVAITLARTDFTTGQVMRRLDRWYHTQLWPEDMPSKSLVVICGQDKLLPVPEILAHLEHSAHPAKILMEPNLGHGGMFFNAAFRKRTMEALKDFYLTIQPASQHGTVASTTHGCQEVVLAV